MVGPSRAFFVVALGLAATASRGRAAEVPMPRLAGDGVAVEHGASLHARDADSRLVLWLLGREGGKSFVAVGGAPLTGTATAPNRAAIFAALSSGHGTTVVRTGPGTAKSLLTIDEPGIDARALLERLAKAAGAKGIAIAPDAQRGETSVSLREVPVDSALAAFAAATGTRVVRGRDLLFMVPKDLALADLPAKKPDGAFMLRVAGASAAQTVALLEAAGIEVDGRVPCESGGPVWLDATDVGSDEAMRAIRVVSGAGNAIGNGDACAPKTWRLSTAPLVGSTPVAVVRTKRRAVALVEIAKEAWLVPLEALPKGARLVSGSAIVLGPGRPATPALDTELGAWPAAAAAARRVTRERPPAAVLDTTTLTATVIDARRKAALFDAGDTVFVAAMEGPGMEIADGAVTLEREAAGREVVPVGRRVVEPPPPAQSVADDAFGAGGGDVAAAPTPTPRPDGSKKNESGGGVPELSSKEKSVIVSAAKDVRSGPVVPARPSPGSAGEPDGKPPAESRDTSRQLSITDAAPQPLWAVEPFGEKPAWLGAHEPSLAARFRGDSWGDTFALVLEDALRERGRRAQAVGGGLSDAQIRVLVQKEALRFVLGGEIRSFSVDGGNVATLAVAVRVRKESAGKMKVVDVRTHPGSVPLAGPVATEAEILELFRAAAGNAADALVDSLPHDLFAVRN